MTVWKMMGKVRTDEGKLEPFTFFTTTEFPHVPPNEKHQFGTYEWVWIDRIVKCFELPPMWHPEDSQYEALTKFANNQVKVRARNA